MTLLARIERLEAESAIRRLLPLPLRSKMARSPVDAATDCHLASRRNLLAGHCRSGNAHARTGELLSVDLP